MYFDALTGDCFTALKWKVVDSMGVVVFDQQLGGNTGSCGNDPGTVTLTKGGTYTLTAYGTHEATGTYSFKLTPQ